MSGSKNEEWTTIITPKDKLFRLNLRELWQYRDLVTSFVKRDITSVYKQTILGPLWFFIQPIFTTLMFLLVFGNIAKIPTDGVPQILFYMNGIILWNYFSTCLTSTSNTFVSNAYIFKKVYFSRLALPVSQVISALVKFSIQFVLFLIMLLAYWLADSPVSPSWAILAIPLFVIQMAMLGLGVGLIVTSLTTKYRDMTHLVAFAVQLWMYATPIVYPLSMVPEKWRSLYMLNPVVPVLEGFKHAFFSTGMPSVAEYSLSIGTTFVLLLAGILIFNLVERNFVDTV
ncbi:ABC transporter permease [bacterium]|nr:ABC transporter permease [bacterium]